MTKYAGFEHKGVRVAGWFEQHTGDALIQGFDDYEFIQLNGNTRKMWEELWRKLRIFIVENEIFSDMEDWVNLDDFLIFDEDFDDMEELTDEDFMI